MFLVGELRKFYLDLQSRDYHSAIACVHSRFSTNTNPSWERAHPNRLILHNGEINTIRGNADRMLAREETMSNPVIDDALDKIYPVVNGAGSDSAMLDNTLEFLVMSGMDLPLAVMVTIPEPWTKDGSISRAKRDLYQYYAIMMEPWDGPASILFSDGDAMGAVLDRNGLRPSRYYITDDGKLILSSEVGALDLDPRKIVKKSRLEPGKMLLVDTVQGRIIDDAELKETYAARQPYGEWLDRGLIRLKDLPVPNKKVPGYSQEELTRLEKAFGYTYEDVKNTILPMARTGAEPTAAMGVDIPLAVLSDHEQPLFNYFKQLFAQVTNPAHRRHPGGGGHRHYRLSGQRRQPAGGAGGQRSRPSGGQPYPHLGRPDEDPGHEAARLPGGDRLHPILQEHPSEAGAGPPVRCGGPGLPQRG